MSIRIKHCIFRHFWWLAILSVVTLAVFAYCWIDSASDWKLPVTLFGGLLSTLYFIQKQKLEETRLFAEVFQSFNNRYDDMNDCLNCIVNQPEEEDLTEPERTQLYDYFNLCAEEYLFYQRGYVPQEVWEAWKGGMRYYMRNPRIRGLWEEDQDRQGRSYYGLQMPDPDGDSSEE